MDSDEIDIRFLTWGSIKVTLDEVMTVVRHRLIVICYFVCWATVYPVRYRPQESSQGIWIEVLIYVMSQVTVISSVVALIFVAARVQKRRPPVVYVTPFIFASQLLGCGVVNMCFWIATGHLHTNLSSILIFATFLTVFAELVGSVVVSFLLPRVISEIRQWIKKPSQILHSAGAHEKVTALANKEVSTSVVVDGRVIAIEDLRLIRTAGNYLDIQLAQEKLFLSGTMRAFLDQLQGREGLLVHRSLWVAAAQIESYHRQGMDIYVRLLNGEEFKAARSRQSVVLAWLKQSEMKRKHPPRKVGERMSGSN